MESAIYLNVIVGLSNNYSRHGGKADNNTYSHAGHGCEGYNSAIFKTIKLPSPDYKVAQLARDIAEKYIPREWLLHLCLCRHNEKKNDVILRYGNDYHTAVKLTKNDRTKVTQNQNANEDTIGLSVQLKMGENVVDSVKLSNDNNVCDFVDTWKWMFGSSISGFMSDYVYLWLDVHQSSLSSLRRNKETEMKHHDINEIDLWQQCARYVDRQKKQLLENGSNKRSNTEQSEFEARALQEELMYRAKKPRTSSPQKMAESVKENGFDSGAKQVVKYERRKRSNPPGQIAKVVKGEVKPNSNSKTNQPSRITSRQIHNRTPKLING